MGFTVSLEEFLIGKQAHKLLDCYKHGENPLPANKIGFSSPKEVHWKCPKCELEWDKKPNRATKDGAKLDCPGCNDKVVAAKSNLGVKFAELRLQWDQAKNDSSPYDYKITSKDRVHWMCPKCRNRWEAVIRDRVKAALNIRAKGHGELCPFCSGQKISPTYNLAVIHSHILNEWDYVKNAPLTPDKCFPTCNDTVWWICSFDPNHRWQDKVSNRTILLRGCPHCYKMWHMTYISRVLFYYLQQAFPSCNCEYPIAGYRADTFLVEEKIIVEHFGYTHQKASSRARDKKKVQLLKEQGIRVIQLVQLKDKFVGFRQDGDTIYFYDESPYPQLDNLINYLFRYLEAVLEVPLSRIQANHVRDFVNIDNLYFLARKKRSLAVCFPEKAEEWSPNNPCRPDVVPAKSGRKYKWICPKCEEEYEATVYNRTHNGTGHSACHRSIRKE